MSSSSYRELALLSARDGRLVGGSLADHGGHNILEPAVFGKPIVFGRHMQNFKEIADAFLANGAAIQVRSDQELDDTILALVRDPVHRARLGAAARALVEANRGAKSKTLAVLGELLPLSSCVLPPGSLSVSVLSSVRRGGHARRWAQPGARQSTETAVVSVGNLSVGGSENAGGGACAQILLRLESGRAF
jgi:hypothetical protein